MKLFPLEAKYIQNNTGAIFGFSIFIMNFSVNFNIATLQSFKSIKNEKYIYKLKKRSG